MKALSFVCAAVVGAFLLGPFETGHAAEAAKPDATLTLSAKAVSAGAGYSWGGGKLMYGGKTYDVTIDGLTVGAVGMTSITASGEVYGLKKLEDFDGNYTAVAAGATIAGGGGLLTMQNQNGVQVTLKSTTQGLSLTLGVSGAKLALKK
ncbi:MAG TPA: hypothetical protein VMR86_10735 [Myxococcota bacterium]|nr:hypothetical protein [Myxococcota bacterium]